MAIKDWIKITKDRFGIVDKRYINKKGKIIGVVAMPKRIGGYAFIVKDSDTEGKVFKTKTQVLKYAKAYMRKH